MLDDIREWISDNLRYILLGLAIILVILIAFFSIRAITHRGSSSDNNTEAVIETEVEEESEEEEAEPLTQNEPEVLDIATDYWTAVGEKDYDTLETLYGKELSDDDREDIDEMDVAVESYDNIATYSKPGLTDGSYVAYVYMDLKLTGIETEAPTLREMYLQPDEDDNLLVVPSEDYTSEITKFTQERQTDSDVQALIKEVNDTLNERCEEDEDLMQYVDSGNSSSSSSDEDEEDGDEDNGSSSSSGKIATVLEGVNIRSEASTDGAILAALAAGAQVTVVDNLDDGWSWISYIDSSGSTQTGYVKTEFLSIGE